MPDILPFLPMHTKQIEAIAASINIGPEFTTRTVSPETKQSGIQACRDAGIEIPAAGAFTLKELDAALDKAFDKSTLSLQRRMEMKARISASGLLLEPIPVDKIAVVKAGLMLKKANIPAPTERPYSVAEFDALMATKADISIPHRLEIKSACLTAGIISEQGTVVTKPSPPKPIEAARQIVSGLGLDMPEPGKKLPMGRVDAAMNAAWGKPVVEYANDTRDFDRRVRAKRTLELAGVI
jgi:hypothetical protein